MNRENIYEQLKIDEGVKYEVYTDTEGHPTFGIGHLILKTDEEYGQPDGTPVSEDRVRECFERDLNFSIQDCRMLYGEEYFDNMPEEAQEVLVNMCFNLGRPRLTKFVNMNSAIRKGNWKLAAIEGRDSRWYTQVGDRAERLMTRLENI